MYHLNKLNPYVTMLVTSLDPDTIVVRNTDSLRAGGGAPLSLNPAEQASIKVFENAVDIIPEALQLSFTTISAVRRRLRRIIHGPYGQHGTTNWWIHEETGLHCMCGGKVIVQPR